MRIDARIQHKWRLSGEFAGTTAMVAMPDGGEYETPLCETVEEAESHADAIYRLIEEWWHDDGEEADECE